MFCIRVCDEQIHKTQSSILEMIGVVEHSSGIGNTIKTLVSAMRFHPGAYATSSPALLYVFPRLALHMPVEGDGSVTYSGWQLILRPHELEGIEHLRLTVDDAEKKPYVMPQPVIDMMYDAVPDSYVAKFLPMYKKLLFEETAPRLLAKAKAFAARCGFGGRDVASVHIRSWYDDPGRKKNWFNLEYYTGAMDSLVQGNAAQCFFLACDDKAIEESIKARYGKRIITYPARLSGFQHTMLCQREGFEDTYIEMLLLGMNKTLVLTQRSSFSECAYWFAMCHFKRSSLRVHYA